MECRPFGREPDGERIQDVSGVTVRANLEYLEKCVAQKRGADAGRKAVEDLVTLLNERLPDPAYHVTSGFLKNPWNSYSYEFVMYLTEFCVELSGDPDFHFNLGRRQILSPIIQALGRPFSIMQIYKLFPYFVEKFTKGALLPEVVTISKGRAVMRLRLAERTKRQFGVYLKGCADRICQTTKATIAEVPARMFGLAPASIHDTVCMGDGGGYCEWTFTWPAQRAEGWIKLGLGLVGTVAVFVVLRWGNPQLSVLQGIGLAALPVVVWWLAVTLLADRREIQERGKVIQDQLEAAEARHEELREAYLNQEHITIELRRRVAELTTLHQAGLRLGATLDPHLIIAMGLRAIIDELHYDRAMMFRYDPIRRVAYAPHVVGVPQELAASLQGVEIPIHDQTGVEATLVVKGIPVLIDDIEEALPRLHPLSRQLVKVFQTKTFVAAPLKSQNRILGALIADRVQADSLTTHDMNLLATVANLLALALDKATAYAEIEQLNLGLEAKVHERTAELEKVNQELSAANERLRELDRLKSKFLSHCSHELRTPLTSIKGFSDNLLQGTTGSINERQRLYLTRISANTDRLTRMIADLLDLSRIEAGTIRMAWSQVSLVELIAEVSDQFQFMAKQEGQILRVSCSDERLTVTGDRDRLHQVLTNLVHNAMKFTPVGGMVSIEAHAIPAQEGVEIAVSDTGPGIPSEALDKLFEPFFQAHRDHEIGSKGLGLGLAIVKSLVDLHGGSIRVDSQPGKGTTVRVMLPIDQVATSPT